MWTWADDKIHATNLTFKLRPVNLNHRCLSWCHTWLCWFAAGWHHHKSNTSPFHCLNFHFPFTVFHKNSCEALNLSFRLHNIHLKSNKWHHTGYVHFFSHRRSTMIFWDLVTKAGWTVPSDERKEVEGWGSGCNVACILYRNKVYVQYSHSSQYLETQKLSKPVQETTHIRTVDVHISTSLSNLHVFTHRHMNPVGGDREMVVRVHRSMGLLCPH